MVTLAEFLEKSVGKRHTGLGSRKFLFAASLPSGLLSMFFHPMPQRFAAPTMLLIVPVVALMLLRSTLHAESAGLPNFVVILTDDQGNSDVRVNSSQRSEAERARGRAAHRAAKKAAKEKDQAESKAKKQTTEKPVDTNGAGPVTTPQPVAGHAPGRRFDLSHWKLTLPTNREGAYEGHPMEIPAEELVGEFNDSHFYSSPDGAMVFWCPVIGTTTEGTKFPRSELREMLEPGNPRKNWKLAGSHVMEARCRVIEVPSNPKVVIGQIHGYAGKGKAPPLVKLQYFKGRVEALVKQSPVEGKDKKLTYPGIKLGDEISWKIEVHDGELAVTVNGTTQRENMIEHDPRWADQTFYFKAGCYPQDNEGDQTEGGRISFSHLIIRHQGE